MDKIAAVEQARKLFTEGQEWSVFKWLAEKGRVRNAADQARAALDECENRIKAQWSEALKSAYADLEAASAGEDDDPFAAAEREFATSNAQPIAEEIRELARRVKQADDEAYRAHEQAEETFALAERRLSVALSKRGAVEAILAYDLNYKAIDEAEAARAATALEPESRR
jgi:hypothetical protein